MSDEYAVKSLSDFAARVRDFREEWRVDDHKELWFRGEGSNYDTRLRPKLYRPQRGKTLKPIPELLDIENDLYESFQHSGVQLCEQRIEEEDWDWDWYFLMQHHGAPTRLLDWSDGAHHDAA